MTFKGLIAATAALALTATPALAAASTARAASVDLAPAAETVDGSELDGGANVVVAILALIAAGLGLWVILDDSDDEPVSP
ncbi:hypothetical protein SH591_10600 [Sphingomonas sp. LY54]|uniref:hypothetical protein n=1 Tax=Sphingomonas sp. LY54 TaxID=3095343 RepID=UPI002D767F77|nr:hypothetical protein [Sphingomonas sp. LY54]WRP27567.1 hypothetical protein SH591_10600 [Sphingomonas sp. LY54]